MQKVDIDTMDAAQANLVQWQAEIVAEPPPVIQSDDVVSLQGLFEDVRAEQHLLSQITLAAIVPLVVLALLLLYVLISSAAEVRRQEVALAKLRGFSAAKVVRFAVAEPVAVLLFAVPVGIALAVVASRAVTNVWLGQTPFVVTPQAVSSAVIVTAVALAGALVAVLGVVREPLAASLASTSRRRTSSRWALLAQGALVMLSAAAVVQVVTSDATQSSSLVELLSPLFVALGASVLAMVGLAFLARLWMRRTSGRGGLSPFLASRRLVRRQDLMQLVLPLLLSTAMATFAASAWKVADDWRVSKAASSGRRRDGVLHRHLAGPALLADAPDRPGRPVPRRDGAARAAHDRRRPGGARRLAAVRPGDHLGSGVGHRRPGAGAGLADGGRAAGPDHVEPATTSPSSLTDVSLDGSLNLPVSLWMRYLSKTTGDQETLPMGEVPMKGDATIKGFASGCEEGCELQQLYFSGSSSSVSDVHGSLTIASIAADGDDPGDWRLTDDTAWRPARPYGTTSGEAPVQLSASASGLTLEIPEGDSTVVRLTSSDLPGAPPMVATTSTQLESSGGRRRRRRLADRHPHADAGGRPRRRAPARRQQRRPVGPRRGAARVRRPVHRRHASPSCWWLPARPPRSCRTSARPAST